MSDRFKNTPISTLLRRVAKARAEGDWTRARDEWHACIARARPRVENVVDKYWGGPAHEADDVVQDVLIRAMRRLVVNLDDLAEEGVFFAAIVEVARLQCIDSFRSYRSRTAKVAGSLDERVPSADGDGDAFGRFDKETARQAMSRSERDEEIADASRRIDSCVPRLKDPRAQKIVMRDRLGGVDDAVIADELGTSVANVYTIRSRAMKELRGLIES